MSTILRSTALGSAAVMLAMTGCTPAARPPASTAAMPARTAHQAVREPPQRPVRDLPALLLDGERKAWQGYDARPLLSLFAPGAEVIGGRTAESSPLDVRYAFGDWATLLAWQLSGRRPNIDDTRVEHENVSVERHGDAVVVELTRVIKSMLVNERVRERFELAWAGEGWRVSRLRWWPIALEVGHTTEDYGPEGLRKLDDAAAQVADTDPRKKARVCFEALRYAESVRWYEVVVASAAATPSDWLNLGWSAAFAGQMTRSRAAFREAAHRDPTLLVPQGALAADGAAGGAAR